MVNITIIPIIIIILVNITDYARVVCCNLTYSMCHHLRHGASLVGFLYVRYFSAMDIFIMPVTTQEYR